LLCEAQPKVERKLNWKYKTLGDYIQFTKNTIEVNSLPKHIPIYKNKIYLYADHNSIRNNRIKVYLINCSTDTIKFDGSQAEWLQQEYLDENGRWMRSQSFRYGFCGLPYNSTFILLPQRYLVFEKNILLIGERKIVRYTFYSSPFESSNRLSSLVDLEDAKKALDYDDSITAIFFSEYDYLNEISRCLDIANNTGELPVRVNMVLYWYHLRYPNESKKYFLTIVNNKANILHDAVMKLYKKKKD